MMAMDSPWATFASADATREYFALLSYLPVNKYRAIPGFLRFAFQIQRQLRTTPGIIGYSLRAKLVSRNFCTLSAWEDEQAFRDFVVTLPPGPAMQSSIPTMVPTT